MRGRTNAVSGTVLPELSNPAGAANIQSGYQAINGDGEVVTGTARIREAVEGTLKVNYSGQRIYYATLTGYNSYGDEVEGTVSVLKNSVLVVTFPSYQMGGCNSSGGCSRIGAVEHTYVFYVTGDFSISITN